MTLLCGPAARAGSGLRLFTDALRLQFDAAWGMVEFSALAFTRPAVSALMPSGGGLGVMAIPGFLADERSLAPLVATLRGAGFDAVDWGLGPNHAGGSEPLLVTLRHTAELLRPAVEELVGRTGRPIALVGQSLGGVYARWLAEHYGELVDRVITLGAPAFTAEKEPTQNQVVVKLSERLSGRSLAQRLAGSRFTPWGADEPPIPLVSIYSPVDGVVGPNGGAGSVSQLHSSAPIRESIGVICSHVGMSAHAATLLVIADRLVEPRAAWQAFDPQRRFPTMLCGLRSQVIADRGDPAGAASGLIA